MASLAEIREPEAAPTGEVNLDSYGETTLADLKKMMSDQKRDTSVWSDMYKSFGTGLYNLATTAAGLGFNILKWTVSGQQAQTRTDRALRSGKSDAEIEDMLLSGRASDERALHDLTKDYYPDIANIQRWTGGPPHKPETVPGELSELFAENLIPGAGLTIGGGRLAAKSIAAGTIKAGEGFAGRLGERYANTSALGLATGEAGVNLAASGGQLGARKLAEDWDVDPDFKPFVQLGAELAGGVGGGLLYEGVSASTRSLGRAVKTAAAQKTKGGIENLSSILIKNASRFDPQKNIDNLRSFAEHVPGTSDIVYPAYKTEDFGLMALANGIATSKHNLGVNLRVVEDELHANAARYLKSRAGSNIDVPEPVIGEASPQAMLAAGEKIKPVFQTIVEQGVDDLRTMTDLALIEARRGVAEVKAMGGNKAAISAAAAKQIEVAYDQARKFESALHGLRPKAEGRPDMVRLRIEEIEAELAKSPDPSIRPTQIMEVVKGTNKDLLAAEQARLAELTGDAANAKQLFESGQGPATTWSAIERDIEGTRKRIEALSGGFTLGDVTDTDKLHALRSWALQLSANAYKGTANTPGNPKLGHYYSQIAEAAADDMLRAYMKTGDEAAIAAAHQANNYTRTLHDIFDRSRVSEVRGRNAQRGARVDPDEVLDALLVPPASAAKGLQSLFDVERFGNEASDALKRRAPTGVSTTPLSDLSEGMFANFYADAVARKNLDGTVEVFPKAHDKFVKDYGHLLDHFPNLKANLLNSETRLRKLVETMDGVDAGTAAMRDPSRNTLQLWLSMEPQQALNGLKESKKPLADAQKTLAALKSDPKGEALPAMRQVIYEDMLSNVRLSGTRDLEHQPMTSATRMIDYMKQNDALMRTFFEPDQYTAIKDVTRELARAQDSMRTGYARGQSITAQQTAIRELMEAPDSSTLQTLFEAAYGSARALGFVARNFPFISHVTAGWTQGTIRDVNEMVQRALFKDPDLLEALLARPDKKNLPVVTTRMRSYFATPMLNMPATQEDGSQPR